MPYSMLAMLISAMFITSGCVERNKPNTPTPTENEASMILDQDKLDMIYSMVDLEGDKGRIYEITYDVDYKLDAALQFGIDGTTRLTQFVAVYLLDTLPKKSAKSLSINYDAGCSAFAVPDKKTGNYLMGRNFDFNHLDKNKNRIMIPLIAVHTAPQGGKKSVSFVDGLFIQYTSGFYTDKTSDLSMLMALPYLLLDGINEDGFAVSVLKLDGKQTIQTEAGKPNIFTTVAMRMLLDRASTVKEATEMLKEYNMCMDQDSTASYHFFMADATGDYAIVEYTNSNLACHPDKMEILTGNDTLRCVTNFYVSPTMAETEYGGKSEHGRTRYETLRADLLKHNYQLTAKESMSLLKQVAQGTEIQETTGFTQWPASKPTC